MLLLISAENVHDVLNRPMPPGLLSAIVQLMILLAALLTPEIA